MKRSNTLLTLAAAAVAAAGLYTATNDGDRIFDQGFEGAYQAPDLQRQYRASVYQSTGYPWMGNVDVSSYDNVFSVAWPATRPTTGWPGVSNGQATPAVQTGHYIAMAFTVPPGYPLYRAGGNDGWGSWAIVGTATQGGAKTITLSDEAGDFNPAHFAGRTAHCRGQAVAEQPWLTWAVVDPGQPVSGFCPLQRGHTYYMNIVVAPADDLEHTSCPGASCKINVANHVTNPAP